MDENKKIQNTEQIIALSDYLDTIQNIILSNDGKIFDQSEKEIVNEMLGNTYIKNELQLTLSENILYSNLTKKDLMNKLDKKRFVDNILRLNKGVIMKNNKEIDYSRSGTFTVENVNRSKAKEFLDNFNSVETESNIRERGTIGSTYTPLPKPKKSLYIYDDKINKAIMSKNEEIEKLGYEFLDVLLFKDPSSSKPVLEGEVLNHREIRLKEIREQIDELQEIEKSKKN